MKNFFRTLIALILSATMLSACSAGVETPGASSVPGQTDASQSEGKSQTEFDRKETLYVVTNMGHSPNSFNPLDGSPSWPVGMQQVLVYETAFMMNMLTQELEPLVGDSYSWTDDLTLEVKLNPAAKFNDGSALTSEDMKYSYELGKKYDISGH